MTFHPWGPFLESSGNFLGPKSHFYLIGILRQRGVYAWNFLYEGNLCSY